MSNHWTPRANNRRNHGGQQVGYVPISGNYNQKNNIIKFYTRVVFENGKWKPDPRAKHGNYVRPANGKNFLKVPNLRGRTNFITVANLYKGQYPLKTVHKWTEVNNERRKPNKGVQYDPGLGYHQGNIGN